MKKNSGVTIVEILLYLGLLSIFLVILVDVFVTGANFKLESESTSTLQSDSQFILAKLANDVANADSIGALGSTLTLSSGTYSLVDGDLVLTVAGQSAKLNGIDTRLNSISFAELGNIGGVPTVRINFEIESRIAKEGKVPEKRSFQTTLGLR